MNDIENSWSGLFLAVLFIVIQLLFQFKMFSYGFTILLILIITVPFFKEQNRLFIWSLFAFFVGELIYFYGDRLLLELPLSSASLLILNRCLMLVPIILMAYVIHKFKQPVLEYWQKTNWNADIFQTTIKRFLIVGIIFTTLIIMPFIFGSSFEFHWDSFDNILLFVLISACLEQLLWRGIMLTRVSQLIGERKGVFFLSIAYGLSYLKFGFSFMSCVIAAIIGFIFGVLTIKAGSLLPAFIWHTILLTLLLLSGAIPILTF